MGTSVHFRGQQCARIQAHSAVSLKTQSPDNTRNGFCDFKMSGEQPRQPKDLQGLLKFCMEATVNEDAPAVPGDPAARLAAMEPERRAWLEEAPHELSHEHVLRAMLTLVQGSSAAKSEARSVHGLSSRLEEWLKEVGGREEGEESEDYCRQLLKELKLEEGVDR